VRPLLASEPAHVLTFGREELGVHLDTALLCDSNRLKTFVDGNSWSLTCQLIAPSISSEVPLV
jgi:hypothetical protein